MQNGPGCVLHGPNFWLAVLMTFSFHSWLRTAVVLFGMGHASPYHNLYCAILGDAVKQSVTHPSEYSWLRQQNWVHGTDRGPYLRISKLRSILKMQLAS